MSRRPLVALLVLPLLIAAACDDGNDPALDTGTVSSTTLPDKTATNPASPRPTSAPLQTPLPTGDEAVQALLGAWQAGDRAGALTVADPPAVDALFAIAPEAAQNRGCNAPGANPNVTCVFRLSVGELQVRAVPRDAGYIVDNVVLGAA
ncbi:MAG: hypothetical protein ACRD0G_10495 [Acidimicrobiales bacterium]